MFENSNFNNVILLVSFVRYTGKKICLQVNKLVFNFINLTTAYSYKNNNRSYGNGENVIYKRNIFAF